MFRIIIRICKKNVEFCEKTSKFLLQRCLFIFCIFYLDEEELNQQVFLIRYVENENEKNSQKKQQPVNLSIGMLVKSITSSFLSFSKLDYFSDMTCSSKNLLSDKISCSSFILSWRRPLSYSNQSLDLLRKSMD